MLNFIVNTHSGKGLSGKNIAKIAKYCYKNNIDYTVYITSAPGHATTLAQNLVDQKADIIVAVGGDGTFHEVLNGITTFENTRLGFIPSGRGNDFARGMGIPRDPIEALKVILRGVPKDADYIKVGDKRCLNIAGTGLDVDVLQRVADKHGKITYLSSLIYCVNHFDPYEISYTLNGETKEVKAIMLGVCNGNQFGGGLKLSPESKCDDGILDVLIMQMPADKKIMKVLFKFTRGKHLNLPITTHIKCESISIRTKINYPVELDGEIYDDLKFDCEIVKGGLKTFDLTAQ